jgi:hypothetical protein
VISHRQHVEAICVRLESALELAPPVLARRLLRPQLRWVDYQLGSSEAEELAGKLGVLALVEAARDEHLASLDADDGLGALSIDWEEVVARACARERERRPTERRRPSRRRGA